MYFIEYWWWTAFCCIIKRMQNYILKDFKKFFFFFEIFPYSLFFKKLFFDDNLLFNISLLKTNFFLKKKKNYFFFKNFIKKLNFFNLNFQFSWYRFILFSGLGYKKKIFSKKKLIFAYIADRHWILYKFNQNSTILPIKRRNFLFFSNSKNNLILNYNFFSSLKTPYVYKMKGFIDFRVRQRFLFVRRIRIRGIKTKLSKKQLLL